MEDFLDLPTPRCQHGWDMRPSMWMHTPFERSFERTMRPWVNAGDTYEKQTHVTKDGFQVTLDVQHFAPNEITVKTVDDNTVVIDAKHEERQDEHGFVSRQFQRRYRLPEGFNAKDVVSSVSSDGILTVKAPPAAPALQGNVRQVQIQQTGPARLNVNNKMQTPATKIVEKKWFYYFFKLKIV